MVGVANVENSRPRSGSNRSTAFTRPSDATWMRSSRATPRLANRRARCSARRRWASISSSRIARSRVWRELDEPLPEALAFLVVQAHVTSAVLDQEPDAASGSIVSSSTTASRICSVRSLSSAATRAVDRAGDVDVAASTAVPEHQLELSVTPVGGDEQGARLADGDAEVLDLVVGEADAGGEARDGQAGQPRVLGPRGQRRAGSRPRSVVWPAHSPISGTRLWSDCCRTATGDAPGG